MLPAEDHKVTAHLHMLDESPIFLVCNMIDRIGIGDGTASRHHCYAHFASERDPDELDWFQCLAYIEGNPERPVSVHHFPDYVRTDSDDYSAGPLRFSDFLPTHREHVQGYLYAGIQIWTDVGWEEPSLPVFLGPLLPDGVSGHRVVLELLIDSLAEFPDVRAYADRFRPLDDVDPASPQNRKVLRCRRHLMATAGKIRLQMGNMFPVQFEVEGKPTYGIVRLGGLCDPRSRQKARFHWAYLHVYGQLPAIPHGTVLTRRLTTYHNDVEASWEAPIARVI
jgi:hypothetical protein